MRLSRDFEVPSIKSIAPGYFHPTSNPAYAIKQHWIKFKTNTGQPLIVARLCLAFDITTGENNHERCPYCSIPNNTVSTQYLVELFYWYVRDLIKVNSARELFAVPKSTAREIACTMLTPLSVLFPQAVPKSDKVFGIFIESTHIDQRFNRVTLNATTPLEFNPKNYFVGDPVVPLSKITDLFPSFKDANAEAEALWNKIIGGLTQGPIEHVDFFALLDPAFNVIDNPVLSTITPDELLTFDQVQSSIAQFHTMLTRIKFKINMHGTTYKLEKFDGLKYVVTDGEDTLYLRREDIIDRRALITGHRI
jgi:hypothetical protein